MKIISVVGARPNFMKIAPLIRAIEKYNTQIKIKTQNQAKNSENLNLNLNLNHLLVHTGQHYDYEMSQIFFQDLDLPQPDIYLGVGSGTHAEQTGKVMVEFEKVLFQEKPDLVIVVGDVNSTLAAALAAVKLHIPVAHIEAGLRCYDWAMPEEINRLLTDHISDYLFTTSEYDDDNLKREGISEEKIFCVGNIMVDSLLFNKPMAEKSDILERLGLVAEHHSPITKSKSESQSQSQPVTPYALLTLHRPGNVDNEQSLTRIMAAVNQVAQRIPIVFPAHPRTQKRLHEFNFSLSVPVIASEAWQSQSKSQSQSQSNVLIIAPLGYLDFLNLEMNSRFVITDSGGIQVETTVLGIPCLTMLDSPVWPITHKQGTNILVGNDSRKLTNEAFKILDDKGKEGKCPKLWDGRTAERIVPTLARGI